FDKFPEADRRLTTQMKATGQGTAIERSFEAALSKALRPLEQTAPAPETPHEPVLIDSANGRRIFAILEALRDGVSPAELSRRSGIAGWFIERLLDLVTVERHLSERGLD